MSKSISKMFRSTVNASTVGLFSYSPNCKLQQHAIHDIRMRFTTHGNKYVGILDHMIKTGKAKSGSTCAKCTNICTLGCSILEQPVLVAQNLILTANIQLVLEMMVNCI